MSRSRAVIVAETIDSSGRKRPSSGATIKLYAEGTASSNGVTTSGTGFGGAVYTALTGGSPAGNTHTADSNGQLVVYSDTSDRYDVGIEYNGAAAIRPNQPWEADPSDLPRYYADRNRFGYVLTPGSASTHAAANTTALQNLWAAVALAGGGRIVLPDGAWALNATALDHGGDFGAVVSLEGEGTASSLILYGTAGPFLNVASTSASRLARCGIRGLTILHAEAVASGSTIRVGTVQQFDLERIYMLRSSSSIACLRSVEIVGATADVTIRGCKFQTRNDHDTMVAAGLTPIGIDVLNTAALGGLRIYESDISGCNDDPSTAGLGVGLRFANAGLVDTVDIGPGTLIKDWAVGISKTIGAGAVANFTASGLRIDGCETVGVQLQPPTGSALSRWLFTGGYWISCLGYGVLADEASGGSIDVLHFQNGNITSAATAGIQIGGGVHTVLISDNTIDTSVVTAGFVAVEVGDGVTANRRVNITGNIATVANATPAAVIRIGSQVDSLVVVGNTLEGGADADGIVNNAGTSTSKVVASNSWRAS